MWEKVFGNVTLEVREAQGEAGIWASPEDAEGRGARSSGKSSPGRGNGTCKGPEAGAGLVFWRHSKEGRWVARGWSKCWR